MDIEKEVYHSNGILGLIPLVDESEAMSFQFGKLITSDSKDFFNCDTTIGLEYPVRSALQPICVHVDGAESTNWVNPPCGDNVDLLDISSKRLPVDLGLNNGLDKSSIYSSNGNIYSSANLTPNNHVISNSLPPPSYETPSVTTDYYHGNSIQQHQHSEIYINNNSSSSSSSSSSSGMRGDYDNHSPLVDNEKIYFNGYYNQQQQQNYDHLNHHHVNHISSHHYRHQIYLNQQQLTTTTTPLHHFHSKRGQPPFQRHQTHRRRLNLYEKSSSSPTKLKNKHQQQPQSPPEAQKPQKPPKPLKSQKSSIIQQRPQKLQKSQDQQPQLPQTKPQQKITKNRLKKLFHGKSLEAKQELNSRGVLKRKIGRPRKLEPSKKPVPKFRSHRLRLKVQSEKGISYSDEVSQPSDGPPDSEVKVEVKEKKVKEVLPCNWVRPDDLSFDRETVSDYEKASLPEFFAGKFDRTHFHPSQYLQIRNIFFDEWEKRKPNAVNFREMIRVHKGIGNVVSFSRVCKFLTAIGAINEISQDDDDSEEENDANTNIKPENVNKQQHDDNQSKSQYEESEELKDPQKQSSPCRVKNGASSTTPSPPPISSTTRAQSEVTSQPKRKGRKRKSYFLNEMTRLGIDPLSAGFPIPNCDKEEDRESREEGDGDKD